MCTSSETAKPQLISKQPFFIVLKRYWELALQFFRYEKLLLFFIFLAPVFFGGCASKFQEESFLPSEISAICTETKEDVYLRFCQRPLEGEFSLSYAQIDGSLQTIHLVTINKEGFLEHEGKRVVICRDKPLVGREMSFILKAGDGSIVGHGITCSHTFTAAKDGFFSYLSCLDEKASRFHLHFRGLSPLTQYTFTANFNYEEQTGALTSNEKGWADIWLTAPLENVEGGISRIDLRAENQRYLLQFPIGKTFIRFEEDEQVRLFLQKSASSASKI